jgi:hypothetical protein
MASTDPYIVYGTDRNTQQTEYFAKGRLVCLTTNPSQLLNRINAGYEHIQNGFLYTVKAANLDVIQLPNNERNLGDCIAPRIPRYAITHYQKIENGKIVGKEMPLQH